MRSQYALEIEWSAPDLPAWVGPFATREEATGWAKLNVVGGTWALRTLHDPYSRGMTEKETAMDAETLDAIRERAATSKHDWYRADVPRLLREVDRLRSVELEAQGLLRQMATPPMGWSTLGTHVDPATGRRLDVELEFWGDDGGAPFWERPVARVEPLDVDAVWRDITACRTYSFGMRYADRLAHETAPALLAEVVRLRGEAAVAGTSGGAVGAVPADAEYAREGVCLLCGGGVLHGGHIDPDRHAAEVERITSGAPERTEWGERSDGLDDGESNPLP